MLTSTAFAKTGEQLGSTPWQLSDDPASVVLELQRTPNLLAETDRTQTVRVYADGRVEVHQPAHLRAAGDYQTRLRAPEVEALLADLDRHGLFTLTDQQLEQERQAAVAERQSREQDQIEIFDGMHTSITWRLAAYTRADGNHSIDFESTLAAENLELETGLYPSAAGLATLAAAERLLLDLANRADLEQTTHQGSGE